MSSTIHILILEDDDLEASILQETLQTHNFTTERASTLYEALTLFATKRFDFVIIDVFINGEPEGITFAKTLLKDSTLFIPFMFLTGHTDRLIFEAAKITNPHGFLLKPFNELELIYSIELIIEKYNTEKEISPNPDTPFFFKKRSSFFKVEPSDIIYLEVEGRYCKIHTITNSFLTQKSLKDLLKRLPQNLFIRVHRNYIINCAMVKEVHSEDNLIILQNNIYISLGRAYKADFFKHYKIIQ